jgi:ATP-binding cassette subfamily B protein
LIKKSIHWLWQASRGIRWRLLLNGLLGLVRVAAGLLFIYVSKLLVDMATHQHQTSPKMIWIYAIALVVLISTELGAGILATWLGNQTEVRMKNHIRWKLFSHLMTAFWDGRERMHSGDVLNRLEEDVRVVTDTLCNALPALIVTATQLLAAFLFLCKLSSTLAWTLIFIMPLFLIVSKIYIKKMRHLTKNIRSTDSNVQSILQESLQHRIVIQSMEQSDTMADKLQSLQQTLYGQVMHRTRFSLFSRTMVSIGFATGYLVAFLWSIVNLEKGAITFGIMTAFLQLVGQIQRPTVDLTRQIPSFIHATTSIDRLSELEDIPAEEQEGSTPLSGIAGIHMNDVSYHYPDSKDNVLEHFTHDFQPGSRTAIVGETGSGKSTTIRLMLALLHPQEGEITLYNTRGDRIASSSQSRCNLVYVPQGNSLLSGTIRDNLLLGNPDATDQEMYEVLHIAAADFVEELPDGLNSICGEQGAGLSEGQAQRIAIARGLLRPGSIMLLDEFSSSLDKETEETLIHRLLESCPNKTMIFITHREMIVQYCSEVINLTRR